jgi:hypothetical protein
MSRLVASLILLVLFGLPACARAHVVPNEAKFQVFLKPEGRRLRVLVRGPLEAMVDLVYPTRGLSGEFLDLDRADFVLRELTGLWMADKLAVYEGDRQLAYPQIVEVRASLPYDASFGSYDQALAHVTGPRLTNSVDFVWNQGLLDALLEYPIESDQALYSIRSKLSTLALKTTTTLRFVPPDGSAHPFEFTGDPGLIHLDPTWAQVVGRFASTGFLEVLGGADYWLFLFVLAIPLGRLRGLVPIAASFIIGEAITLSPSGSLIPDSLWFQPFVGLLIAVAILFMAIENGLGAGVKRRWIMAFAFGLVVGFLFSFALEPSLQYAGTHRLTSLTSFSLGLDVAQVLVLALCIPAVQLLFRLVTARAGTFLLSLMAGDIAWHRMLERGALLWQYQFAWPALTPAVILTGVTWTMNVVIAVAVFWLLLATLRRFRSGGRPTGGAIAEGKR